MYLKVGAGESAVLCTDNKTFAIQQVETSNTLLLLPVVDRRLELDSSFASASASVPSTAASERCLLVVDGVVSSHLEVWIGMDDVCGR